VSSFVFFVCFSGLIFGLDSFLNRLYATFLNVVTTCFGGIICGSGLFGLSDILNNTESIRYESNCSCSPVLRGGISIWFIRWFRVRLYEGLISYL
jgi:hypothetical protein